MNVPDLLPTRLNHDTIIFMGCSAKELQWIALFSLVLCMVLLSVLTQLLFGMFLVGVGFAFPSAVVVSCFFGSLLQRAKLGKPKGYVKQLFLIECEKLGLSTSVYIRRSGTWSLGRRTQ